MSSIAQRLLIVADDFGLTEGVSAGILESMERGVVTATSAMTAVPGGIERLRRHASALRGRVGLHLQLTDGRPCLPAQSVGSLVGADGEFPRKQSALRMLEPSEIESEWAAQMEAFRSTGLEPVHIDTHHHVHRRPDIFGVYQRLARRWGVRARAVNPAMANALDSTGVLCCDYFEGGWTGKFEDGDRLVERLLAFRTAPPSTVELSCHPGKSCPELRRFSFLTESRDFELGVLTSGGLKTSLGRSGFQLVTSLERY